MQSFRKIIPYISVEKAIAFLKDNEKTILTLLVVFILADILLVKRSSDLVIFSVLLLYGIFIKIFKINSKLTFSLCLGLLAIMSVGYFFTGASISTEKAAVWVILFLVIGVIQQCKE